MNSGLENGGFECPRGFSIEDVASQLYLEDLDEDSELWLVRMPSDVDPSTLENQQIDLSNDLNKISNGDNSFDCISERCKMPNLSLVLPQKESRRLTRVKKTFQGSILLCDAVMEGNDLQVKIEYEGETVREENNEETDDNFVNNEEMDDNFVKPKSKKHKHSKQHRAAHSEDDDLPVKMEDDGENVLEENNEEADDNFVKPKSKKHKRNKELKAAHSESDISSRNEDSETGSTKKKKSHKKKKSIVKVEPSSEGDDFPNCISQQN